MIVHIEDAFTGLRSAMAAQDKGRTEAAWNELGASIVAARQDSSIWCDIFAALEAFRRLSESERKRMVQQEYMVDIDSVMNFVGAVAGILRETIRDRETISIIQNKVQRLLEVSYGQNRK